MATKKSKNDFESYVFNPIMIDDTNHQADLSDPDLNYFDDVKIDSKYFFPEDILNSYSHKGNNFSILHLNIRGMKTNFENFLLMLEETKFSFDILCLTETWCSDHDFYNNSLFSIKNYDSIHYERKSKKKGGGIVLYLKTNLMYKKRDTLKVSDDDIESFTIEIINNRCKNTIINCGYRPPNGNVKNFSTFLNNIFKSVNNERKSIFMIGDFNLDCFRYDKSKVIQDFYNNIFQHGVLPLINRPTRVTTNTCTLIDNIFSNCFLDATLKTGIIKTPISDHFPIFSIISRNTTKINTEIKVEKRNINSKNFQSFKTDLINTNWSILDLCGDNVNNKYNLFSDIFMSMYNKNFPITKINIRQKDLKSPWMSKGLKKSSKRKQKLYIKYLKKKSAKAELEYKTYKNMFEKMKQKAKKLYYRNLLNLHKNDSKKIWNTMKEITGKSKSNLNSLPNALLTDRGSLNTNIEIANELNTYFTSVGPKLAQNIPMTKKDYKEYLTPSEFQITNEDLSLEELEIAFKSLKRNKATGVDDMNGNIIIDVFEEIKLPIFSICKSSLQAGVFPDALKNAKVTPIFKAGDSSLSSNYRPISVLPVFSKILERIMYKRVYSFLKRQNLLFSKQFGFQENSSTEHAILTFVENVIRSFEKGEFTLGVFIDLSKAFDTVNHSILLTKLSYYGIQGTCKKWFASYLQNRKQCISLGNGLFTKNCNLICGVPQGSILGPLLFLIYVNDLFKASKVLSLIMFADDSNLFHSDKNINDLFKTMNIELNHISEWFKANKLSLNKNKTKFLLFHSSHRRKLIPIDLPPLEIDKATITRCSNTKFLGVLVDENLNWKPHIDSIRKKISKSIGILYKTRFLLNKSLLKILYFSFVHSHLSYGNIAWASTFKSKLYQLYRHQKHAIRVINFKDRFSHTQPLFKEMQVPTLFEINLSQTLCLMFKCKNRTAPSYFHHLFQCKATNKYITRSQGSLSKPSILRGYGKFTMSYRGPELWNQIIFQQKELLNQQSFSCFKFLLKRYLIQKRNNLILEYF